MTTATTSTFDAIVIGSGMAGLTSASLLAQLGKKRVLVLERHFKAGGFTHAFRRGKYEWDVGVHYVGGMGAGSVFRQVSDLVTTGQVDWQRLPEPYDRFVYPDLAFEARAGRERLRDDLIGAFPHERRAVERYFADIKKVLAWFGRYAASLMLPRYLRGPGGLLRAGGARLALMTTGAYLAAHVADPKLRAVLASQWGDYGLPPGRSAFVTHAVIADHYMDGAYYPVGGAGAIAKSVIPVVEAHGGQVLVNRQVERILVRRGRAVGVEVSVRPGGAAERYDADTVISNAGSYATYTKLLDEAHRPAFARTLERFPAGTANVSLFLGLKADPRTLGFRGENHWLYDGFDHDAAFAARNALLGGEPHHAYLSFPSLKTPDSRGHTAEVLAFLDAAPFQVWADRPWKRRGGDYEALKARIADALVAFVNRHYPGFAELVDYAELATPLSTETFTGHRAGAVYGAPGVPERYRHPAFAPRTPIKNLYLVGADAPFHGVAAVMMFGALTTGLALGGGRGVWAVLRAARAAGSHGPGASGASGPSANS